jgi:hypothetical protein
LSVVKKYLKSDFWDIVINAMEKNDMDTAVYFTTHLNKSEFYNVYVNLFTDASHSLFFSLIEQFSFVSCLFFSFCIYILKTNLYQPGLVDIVKVSLWISLANLNIFVKQVLYYNRQKFSDYNISLIKKIYFWKSNKLKSYYF